MADQYPLYEIVITAIVVKDGKYLITRRSLQKKRFPGMWTIPGGHLEPKDYLDTPKETKDYWYNVLEKTLARELHEEVGIEVENVEYVTSLATEHTDGKHSLVISCIADYVSGEITLQKEETDKYEWVSLEEAKNYDLIAGIYDELVMAENHIKGKKLPSNDMDRYTLRFNSINKNIFDQIKNGSKKVETRAATVKYKNIKAGDTLILVCGKDKFEKKIKKAVIFKTISAILKKYQVRDIMPELSTKKELENAYYSYPGYKEKIKNHGLVAMEL